MPLPEGGSEGGVPLRGQGVRLRRVARRPRMALAQVMPASAAST
ncbi:hypothetical protein ACIBEF_00075 [Micromonospora sp. NPDC050795]